MVAALALRLGVVPSALLAEDDHMIATMIDLILEEEEHSGR